MGREISDRVARFTAFATIGILSTTQELAGITLGSMEGAEPDIIAEETLCLVSITTARAAEVGLKAEPDAQSCIIPVLLDFPFLYRDFLIGGTLVASEEPPLLNMNDEIYHRLSRKMEFYAVHFPSNQFPGEIALRDKMALWMGRISPPGLSELPIERMEKLEAVPMLLTHLKLILAFGRQN